MGFNLKTISQSWFDSYFGTNEQKLLAQERLKVCDTCPSREELFKNQNWSVICGECGCPLSKKIFSKKGYTLMAGFGIGLSWSSFLTRLDKTKILPIYYI